MEEWKKSVLVGAILLVLAIIFAIIRNEINMDNLNYHTRGN